MGNGWEKDGTETIGNPHRPKGGRNKNDFLENTGKTERSVEINNIEKNEGDRKDKSGSKTTSNNPCPVGRLLAGEGLLIACWFFMNSLAGGSLSDIGIELHTSTGIGVALDIVAILLLFGGPVLTIVFWNTDTISNFCRALSYVNFYIHAAGIQLLIVFVVFPDNVLAWLLYCFFLFTSYVISLFLGAWIFGSTELL